MIASLRYDYSYGTCVLSASWLTLDRLTAIKPLVVLNRFFRKKFPKLKALLIILGTRPIQDLDTRLNRIQSHLFKGLVCLLHRAAAPAKAPERSGQSILGAEPPEMRQELGNTREHNIIQRRRTHQKAA